MKENSIFIDLRNKEQVTWFNEVCSKLIKVVRYETIVETATNKPVGYIIMFNSLFKRYILNKNKKFLDNPVTAVFSVKE